MNVLEDAPLWAHVDGKLEMVHASRQELELGKAMAVYLERLLREFSRSGREVVTQTKLLGKMSYRELTVGRGKRRHTQHTVKFVDEDYAFYYEEMRHALQIAIYAHCGEPVSLMLDFDMKAAYWRFLAGSALSDVVR